MFKDINLLGQLLSYLAIVVGLAALYENWSYFWPFGAVTSGAWSAFGSIVQAAVAVLLWIVSRKQASIAKEQADIAKFSLAETRRATEIASSNTDLANKSMILANRPWLKVDFDEEKRGVIQWNGNSISASLHFKLSNMGRSPAINVKLAFKLEVRPFMNKSPPFEGWPHERIKAFADLSDAQWPKNYPNYTVFQGDTVSVWKQGGFADENYISIDVPKYLAEQDAQHTDRFAGFYIIGVASYQFQPDGEIFRSGILMETYHPNGMFVGLDQGPADFKVVQFMLGSAPIT